jgi:hypothetical protein
MYPRKKDRATSDAKSRSTAISTPLGVEMPKLNATERQGVCAVNDRDGVREVEEELELAARVDDEPVEALELILAPLLQRDRIEDRIGAEESPALWVDSPHHLPDPHGSALLAEDGCIAATASIMDQ